MARLSGPPIDPPNYREGTTDKHCGNCKMYDKGECWGYGNHPVEFEGLCDSWSKETSSSVVWEDD